GRKGVAEVRRGDLAHERVDLAAVRVPLDGDVEQTHPLLRRVGDLAGEHDRAGTRAEHRPPGRREPPDRVLPRRRFEELPEGRRLAARNDEPGRALELLRLASLEGVEPDLAQPPAVRREVALQSEDGDLSVHQPLPCIRASSGRLAASIPFIPVPRDSSASTSACASCQCVVAFTMARARRAGSSDLKIPEPTKIASAPSIMHSAASAGVATPPAAKFGTGIRPLSATSSTSSNGAARRFASRIRSSLLIRVRLRMSRWTSRRCLTAWTMSPVPASPFVRIIAAPSPIRRSASPRFRQPHTNGTVKSCL